MKYYVVLVGRKPGMYRIWAKAKEQVEGYPGALHKSFDTEEEAVAYQETYTNTITQKEFWKKKRSAGRLLSRGPRFRSNPPPNVFVGTEKEIESAAGLDETYVAYTDGSYMPSSGRCGFGIVLLTPDDLQENYCGNVSGVKKSSNVAELYAIFWLLDSMKSDEERALIIYTDSYYCIQVLSSHKKPKKNQRLIERIKDRVHKVTTLELRHVKSHTGIKFNEIADQLADVGREIDEPFILHSVVDLQ